MVGEEDFDMSELQDTGGDDPQWRDLDVTERKELMHNVFSDETWYDGLPIFQKGTVNPPYDEIATRVGAPTKEVRRYYAAWLTSRDIDAQEAMRSPNEPTAAPTSSDYGQPAPQSTYTRPPTASVGGGGSAAPGAAGAVKGNIMGEMMGSMFSGGGQPGANNDMEWMMKMMMLQQIMQTENAQFTAKLSLDQQNIQQTRDAEFRRESMARMDSQNSQQQNLVLTLLKEGRKPDEFTEVIKVAAMDRLADGLFGGGGESAAERIIGRVLDPKAIGAAVGAAKSAMGGMGQQVPAGYDMPSYNPYAQPMTVEQPLVEEAQIPPPEMVPMPEPPAADSDNFFGSEEPLAVAQPPAEQPSGEQPVPEEPNPEEYERALLQSFQQLMGGELEDEKTLTALQEQIGISSQRVLFQSPDLLPQAKLDLMSKELVLIRSLRDIGLGLREAKERIDSGSDEDLVLGFIKDELSKQPVFLEIFSTNTYEELLMRVEPYKHTGGIKHDYDFLLKPDVADVCRKVLTKVQEG